MSLDKQEISAILKLIEKSQSTYTFLSSREEYNALSQKLRDQLYKLTV